MDTINLAMICATVIGSVFIGSMTLQSKQDKVEKLPEPAKVEYVLVAFGDGVQNSHVGPKFYDVGTDPTKCMKVISYAVKDMAKDLVVMNTAFCVPKDVAEKQT